MVHVGTTGIEDRWVCIPVLFWKRRSSFLRSSDELMLNNEEQGRHGTVVHRNRVLSFPSSQRIVVSSFSKS